MDEQGTNKKENEDCKIITLFHFTRLENIFDIIEKDRLKVQETRVSVSEKSIRYDSGSLYTYGFNKYLRGVVLGPKCEAPKLLIRKLLEKEGLPDLPISKAIFSENSYNVEVLEEKGTWGAIKPPPCDMRENAISALIERNKAIKCN